MKTRKLSISLMVIGFLLMAGVGSAQTVTYVYDDINRLVEVKYAGDAKVGYAYDKAGNRETASEAFGLKDVIVILESVTGIHHTGSYSIVDIDDDGKIGL